MSRLPTDTTGRAGEHYVAAELNRHGVYATPFSGNVPGIDIIATDVDRKRMVYIQVKTRRWKGNWHSHLKHGWAEITLRGCPKNGTCSIDCTPQLEQRIPGKPDHYWVFVTLLQEGGQRYYVVPDDHVRAELIRNGHLAYLARKGGQRPGKDHDNLHRSFSQQEVQEWENRWDLLNVGM